MSLKVGIFNCPKVERNNIVEVVYDCYSINDKNYNYRVVCKAQGVDLEEGIILVKLPNNYKQIGHIEGWFGRTRDSDDIKKYNLKPNEKYWWIRAWRRVDKKNLELE